MPPLIGVAVKVALLPPHIDAVVGVMLTDGATVLTVTVAWLEVAVTGLAHGSLLVITTVTLSPLLNVDEVKVEPVAPAAFVPFTCHW